MTIDVRPMRFARRTLQVFTSLGLAVSFCGCATGSKEPPLTTEQRQANLASFDEVWTTIRDTHWDPELGGLDWEAMRDEYRPKVAAATDMSEARGAMGDLIARLQQTHFSIIPKELYEELDGPHGKGRADGGTGIDIRLVDGRALITSVDQDSPAEKLGVKPGWIVLRVDDEAVEPKLERLHRKLADATHKRLRMTRWVTDRLTGAIGDTLQVEFLDERDRSVVHDITLTERRGRKVKLGLLPPHYVWFESRRLAGNIGYIAFNAFMDPLHVMGGFNEAMVSFMDTDGIIIDLRGNPGGIGAMALGMASWLITEKNQQLGTMYLRTNEMKFVVNPRAQTYSGPVVLLVDGMTGSTAEIFAGGLKDLGRATIVGSRTAGAALPATMSKLPNGDGFLHAIANYISAGGEPLEGVGAIPHFEVAPTREQLLAGRDVFLEKAVAVFKDPELIVLEEPQKID